MRTDGPARAWRRRRCSSRVAVAAVRPLLLLVLVLIVSNGLPSTASLPTARADPAFVGAGAAGQQATAAVLVADLTSGTSPLAVVFDGSGSSPSVADIASNFTWALAFGDGSSTGGEGVPPGAIPHTYLEPGTYTATLTYASLDPCNNSCNPVRASDSVGIVVEEPDTPPATPATPPQATPATPPQATPATPPQATPTTPPPTTTSTTTATTVPPPPPPGDPVKPRDDDEPDRPDDLRLDRPSVVPGGQAVAEGRGCRSTSGVVLRIGGRVVGRTTADDEGAFRTELDPLTAGIGRHEIVARCGPVTLRTTIDIVQVTSSGGASSATVGMVMVFFVLLGLLVVSGPNEEQRQLKAGSDVPSSGS